MSSVRYKRRPAAVRENTRTSRGRLTRVRRETTRPLRGDGRATCRARLFSRSLVTVVRCGSRLCVPFSDNGVLSFARVFLRFRVYTGTAVIARHDANDRAACGGVYESPRRCPRPALANRCRRVRYRRYRRFHRLSPTPRPNRDSAGASASSSHTCSAIWACSVWSPVTSSSVRSYSVSWRPATNASSATASAASRTTAWANYGILQVIFFVYSKLPSLLRRGGQLYVQDNYCAGTGRCIAKICPPLLRKIRNIPPFRRRIIL